MVTSSSLIFFLVSVEPRIYFFFAYPLLSHVTDTLFHKQKLKKEPVKDALINDIYMYEECEDTNY